MSGVLSLFAVATIIFIKLFYAYNENGDNEETNKPLGENYWMIHDPKYNPYNT